MIQQQMILLDQLTDILQLQDDLYFTLTKQPISIKKQSSCYDYRPNKLLINLETQNSIEECSFSQQKKQDHKNISFISPTTVRKCTCEKSKCQKNYCSCFKLGQPCGQQCGCTDCCNKIQLFKPVEYQQDQTYKCKCQKSRCQKKYCLCHSNGRKCGKQCQCIECNNNLQQQRQMEQEQFQFQTLRKRTKLDELCW